MIQKLLSPSGISQQAGVGLIRIVVGIFMIYHGWEVFEKEKIDGYTQWLTDLHFPIPRALAYLGKGTELVAGICLALGLFTRLATIPLMITMCVIVFGMGHAKIFTDDQHPFLFFLLFLALFFTGPGKWSLDNLIFKKGLIHAN